MFNTTAFNDLNKLDLFSNVRKKHQDSQNHSELGAPDWGSNGPLTQDVKGWTFSLQS